MLFCGIAAWKERQTGVMQWKMACTYDLRQLTACRMLLLGGLGAALEALLGLFLSAGTGGEVEVLRAVGVSLCGLFAYGWAQLLLLRSAKWARNGWLLPCAWIMAQAALLAACLLYTSFSVTRAAISNAAPQASPCPWRAWQSPR